MPNAPKNPAVTPISTHPSGIESLCHRDGTIKTYRSSQSPDAIKTPTAKTILGTRFACWLKKITKGIKTLKAKTLQEKIAHGMVQTRRMMNWVSSGRFPYQITTYWDQIIAT